MNENFKLKHPEKYIFIENFEYDGDIFPIYQHKETGYYVGFARPFCKFTRPTVDRVKNSIEDWYERTFNPENYDWEDYYSKSPD